MQKQPGKKTVQGCFEEALKKINIHEKIIHAGRTDRGVHALNQVIAFRDPLKRTPELLKNKLNRLLPPEIHIKKLSAAHSGFHPRFDAKKRSYRYILTPLQSPFTAKYTTFYSGDIDTVLLSKALKELEGCHDFEYFAKTGGGNETFVREIYSTKIFKYKNLTVIKIEGNGFLRGQIRIIVNFLLKINEGALGIDELKKQLKKKKLYTKHPASPNGLYLERIWY